LTLWQVDVYQCLNRDTSVSATSGLELMWTGVRILFAGLVQALKIRFGE